MDPSILEGARLARFCAGSILIWDHMVTLDEEIDFIWRKRWSFTKFLFLWIFRYNTDCLTWAYFFMMISPTYCELPLRILYIFVLNARLLNHVRRCDFGFRWQYIAGTFSILNVEIILQLRLYAMYGMSKTLLCLTSLLCLAELGTIMGIVGQNLVDMDVGESGRIVCCALPHPRFFGGYWGPILGYETFLFALALFKGYQNSLAIRNQRELNMTTTLGSRLINSLVKHSVIYFLVIFVVYFINFIVPFVIPFKVEYFVEFAMTFSCIAGNRIVLGARRAFLESTESDSPSNLGERSETQINFRCSTPPSTVCTIDADLQRLSLMVDLEAQARMSMEHVQKDIGHSDKAVLTFPPQVHVIGFGADILGNDCFIAMPREGSPIIFIDKNFSSSP